MGGFPYDECADIEESKLKYAWETMPKDFLTILEGALNEDPEKRYTMEELEKALLKYGEVLIQMKDPEILKLAEHINEQHKKAYV